MFVVENLKKSLQYSPFEEPSKIAKTWLKDHPTTYKVAIFTAHLINTAIMAPCLMCMPYSVPVNYAIVFGARIFYRIAVEGNCPFHFVIPSFIGAVLYQTAHQEILSAIQGAAFNSLANFAQTAAFVSPLLLYAMAIVYISHYEVEVLIAKVSAKGQEEGSCCSLDKLETQATT